MRILILGCDKAGEYLANAMAHKGHQITIMDSDPALLNSLSRENGVEPVLTSESLMQDLRGIDINNVEVFIALSDDDVRNAMAAQVARHIFHIQDVICRIGDPQRQKFYKDLGINAFSPTMTLVETIEGALTNHA